ncbi:hypothetical protein CPJCM30710_20820 [Clostridium polyendosporum]|uniref:Uncharacterized protein n=1 Tax=Clostridium polyendosporum TaxID=69208 RepID=A0A919VH83_9CLOT|nr:hypothetical protein [Clostridium polyendosporum]GIM29416.1 hypothetical protein CPJCM30710_20820 [Clostridium polyendosporum]
MKDYKQLFDGYFIEVNNISDLLVKYVTAYRTLIGSAGELNGIALARKKDVRNAIKRANQLGDIIDVLLDTIENIECCYLDYIRLKANVIAQKTSEECFGESFGESILLLAVLSQLLPEDHPFFTTGQLGGLGGLGGLGDNFKNFKNIFPKGRNKKKGKDIKKNSKNDNKKNINDDKCKDDKCKENDDNHNDDDKGKEPNGD